MLLEEVADEEVDVGVDVDALDEDVEKHVVADCSKTCYLKW